MTLPFFLDLKDAETVDRWSRFLLCGAREPLGVLVATSHRLVWYREFKQGSMLPSYDKEVEVPLDRALKPPTVAPSGGVIGSRFA